MDPAKKKAEEEKRKKEEEAKKLAQIAQSEELTEEEKMMALMGFGGFETTKVGRLGRVVISWKSSRSNSTPSCLGQTRSWNRCFSCRCQATTNISPVHEP